MLVYLFWHWPVASVNGVEYEANLGAFHAMLREHPSKGFRYSAVIRVGGVVWGNPNGATYQDWYVLDDSTALDPLNEAAVSGPRLAPHNLVARQALDGTGSLYRRHSGNPTLGKSQAQVWFSKPTDLNYGAFFEAMKPLTDQPGVELWQRYMTLGPSPEFCLQSQERVELPTGFGGLYLEATPVWVGV